MPRWYEYLCTDASGVDSSAVLELYSDGTFAWFTPNGSHFDVPVPGTNVVVGEISAPVWAHDDPPPKPYVPPRIVTPRQFRIALNEMGLRQSVEDAVQASNQNTQDTWEFAISIDRDHPTFQALASQLGFTEEQLDELFRKASGVQ